MIELIIASYVFKFSLGAFVFPFTFIFSIYILLFPSKISDFKSCILEKEKDERLSAMKMDIGEVELCLTRFPQDVMVCSLLK